MPLSFVFNGDFVIHCRNEKTWPLQKNSQIIFIDKNHCQSHNTGLLGKLNKKSEPNTRISVAVLTYRREMNLCD